jgi:RHS repeat-associated protein
VVAVVDSTGTLVEGARYSAYGVPIGVPAGDTNTDLAFDSTDSTNITGWSPPASYDVRYDVNLDGAITSADASAAATVTLGRGVLSSAAVDNRRGYAAYEFWPQPAANMYSVRHRVLHSDLGRWTRRDPIGYVDGPSLYAYVQARALFATDPFGLERASWPERLCCVRFAGPISCKVAWELSREALHRTRTLFPQDPLVDSEGDAFRHCYWSCRMAASFWIGPNEAKDIGDCHEEADPNNPPASKFMDLWNNRIGRWMGVHQCSQEASADSKSCCESRCKEALDNLLITDLSDWRIPKAQNRVDRRTPDFPDCDPFVIIFVDVADPSASSCRLSGVNLGKF